MVVFAATNLDLGPRILLLSVSGIDAGPDFETTLENLALANHVDSMGGWERLDVPRTLGRRLFHLATPAGHDLFETNWIGMGFLGLCIQHFERSSFSRGSLSIVEPRNGIR